MEEIREPTREECPQKPGFTHHLTPSVEDRGRKRVMRCTSCGKPESIIRAQPPTRIIQRPEDSILARSTRTLRR